MKTQREIMDQREKNKCILLDEIEKCSGEPMTTEIAQRLNTYRGAYKALCMEKRKANNEAAETFSRTQELDGDTEFEQVIMKIPVDTAHMMAVFNILADHMEQLSILNQRAYKNLMLKFREVAGE